MAEDKKTVYDINNEESSSNEAKSVEQQPEKLGFKKPDDRNIEKLEEAKLRTKYGPALVKPGGSIFLQKKLQKRQKYFDSGDYNMEKSGAKSRVFGPQQGTGGVIPTPDSLPTRKPSIVQSKLATGMS